jgi:oxygen-independent coproporphyrinogen-3 oxidase
MGIGLYIHIPFCKAKCLYCDFPSYSGIEQLMPKYIEALCEEIKSVSDKQIDTIFIGGGTPTYLSVEAIKSIGEAINNLNLDKNLEFTVEGNPGTFSEEKLSALKEIGVNRLSIGLQAVQEQLLKTMGRIHDYSDFLEGYLMAKRCGFNNINVDIMFGLPGQSTCMWEETLKKIVDLKPKHISCYSLILEEGTYFYENYKEEDLPSEEEEREMYNAAKTILKDAGFKQYEISNFAIEGYECRHNLIYWELKNYIGLGASAHSYYNGIRYRNNEDVKKYISDMLNIKSSIAESHVNSLEDDIEEFMFLGLRKIDGVSILQFNSKFNKDITSIYGAQIKKHTENGLLILEGDRLKLSERGIELSNFVMSDFIF